MTTNETTSEAVATVETQLPFPSHVKSPAPNADVQAVAREIVDTSRDLNNVLASAGNVHNFVRAHYVDTNSGVYGIERLIAQILLERGAVFPQGIEDTQEFRGMAVQASLFAHEIIAAVQETFGTERYPAATIHCYLSTEMKKKQSVNKVGTIKLKTHEDIGRPCKQPRRKYYLLEENPA